MNNVFDKGWEDILGINYFHAFPDIRKHFKFREIWTKNGAKKSQFEIYDILQN